MKPRGMDKAIRDHFKIPKKVAHQIAGANADLYYGPLSVRDARDHGVVGWKGYGHALDVIQNWIGDKVPSEMWFDSQSDQLLESEPESWKDEETGEWVEPFWQDYYKLERRDILKSLLGSELAANL